MLSTSLRERQPRRPRDQRDFARFELRQRATVSLLSYEPCDDERHSRIVDVQQRVERGRIVVPHTRHVERVVVDLRPDARVPLPVPEVRELRARRPAREVLEAIERVKAETRIVRAQAQLPIR